MAAVGAVVGVGVFDEVGFTVGVVVFDAAVGFAVGLGVTPLVGASVADGVAIGSSVGVGRGEINITRSITFFSMPSGTGETMCSRANSQYPMPANARITRMTIITSGFFDRLSSIE